MSAPYLAVSIEKGFPLEFFEEFMTSLNNDKLEVYVEERNPPGLLASTTLDLVTVAAVFIASGYFNGFLQEAGKEHYHSLKKLLTKTTNKIMSTPRIEPTLIGSPGKVEEDSPYSLAFSIYAEANNGKKFKLLIPKPSENQDYENIICKFLEFLNDYHNGVLLLSEIGFDEGAREKLILIHFNPVSAKIEYFSSKNKA